MSGQSAEGPDLGPDAGSIWAAQGGALRKPAEEDRPTGAEPPVPPSQPGADPGGWRVWLPETEAPVSVARSGDVSTASAILPQAALVVTGEGHDDAAALAALALDVARSGRRALLAPGEAAPTEDDPKRVGRRADRRTADGLRGVCEAAGLPFESAERALAALAGRMSRDAEEIARLRAEAERVEEAHVNAANHRDQWRTRCEELEAEAAALRGSAERAKAVALDAIREAERSVLSFDPGAGSAWERLAQCGWQPCDAARTLWRHPLYRGGEPTAVARALAACAAWTSLG